MKNIELTSKEYVDFVKIAKQHNETFKQSITNNVVIITASITFLTLIGY